MEITTRRKVTTIAVASMLALAVASGSAFAGKSGGTADNGTKNGTDNKKASATCPSDYERLDSWGDYDVNRNGYVCYKWTEGGDSYIDDTSWKW